MSEKTYIYGLMCPVEEKIRYVGQSVDPVHRYRQHINLYDAPHKQRELMSEKQVWIATLKDSGLRPELIILEVLDRQYDSFGCKPDRVAFEAERKWMQRLMEDGHPLTNRKRDTAGLNIAEENKQILQLALQLGQQMFGKG